MTEYTCSVSCCDEPDAVSDVPDHAFHSRYRGAGYYCDPDLHHAKYDELRAALRENLPFVGGKVNEDEAHDTIDRILPTVISYAAQEIRAAGYALAQRADNLEFGGAV